MCHSGHQWFSGVGRVSVKKVDVIKSGQSGLQAVGVAGSLCEVNLHQVPAWANGAGRGTKKRQSVDARMAECN